MMPNMGEATGRGTSEALPRQGEAFSARAAAAHAGVSDRTVRRAIATGALAAEHIDGAYTITPAALAAWMAARHATLGTPIGTAAASPAVGRTDQDAELARLSGENAELRSRLADAQTDRDRWHATATAALERYDRDVSEMRTLLGREQLMALSATASAQSPDMPSEVTESTLRDARPVMTSESLQPASEGLLRRLWKAISGG